MVPYDQPARFLFISEFLQADGELLLVPRGGWGGGRRKERHLVNNCWHHPRELHAERRRPGRYFPISRLSVEGEDRISS